MSESSESPSIKERLSEGVLLALVPALGIAVVYIYEASFCSEFSVPLDLVRPDAISILGVSALLLMVVGVVIPLLDTIMKAAFALKGGSKLMGKSLVSQWSFTIAQKRGRLAMFFVLGAFLFPTQWWIFLVTFIGWVVIDIMTAFEGSKDPAEAIKRFASTPSEASRVNIFTAIEQRFGKSAGLLIGITVFAISLAFVLGGRVARGRSQFLVPASHPNAVLVRNYGDKYICVELDAATKKLTKKIIIITSTDDKFTQFTVTNLGKILQPKNYPAPSTANPTNVPTNAITAPNRGTNSALAVPVGGP